MFARPIRYWSMLVSDSPSMTELFTFGVSCAELARQTPILLAGVLPQDIATLEQVRFGEAVAANRGFVTWAFVDIEQARDWLRNAKN